MLIFILTYTYNGPPDGAEYTFLDKRSVELNVPFNTIVTPEYLSSNKSELVMTKPATSTYTKYYSEACWYSSFPVTILGTVQGERRGILHEEEYLNFEYRVDNITYDARSITSINVYSNNICFRQTTYFIENTLAPTVLLITASVIGCCCFFFCCVWKIDEYCRRRKNVGMLGDYD